MVLDVAHGIFREYPLALLRLQTATRGGGGVRRRDRFAPCPSNTISSCVDAMGQTERQCLAEMAPWVTRCAQEQSTRTKATALSAPQSVGFHPKTPAGTPAAAARQYGSPYGGPPPRCRSSGCWARCRLIACVHASSHSEQERGQDYQHMVWHGEQSFVSV